ncbi:nuclear factor of activated T-cells, cytoplasmic 3 isoform X2 [Alosa sapidissima]|uniref:nuclear factor of activated T-cells, cytoplasmic 3 isoform X2 n=1 Tax=Alosa sapidissima TaxID=34773 RepID=UPI001C08617E|nr:nuclear factor of activated T-cells, cytoplasmic 3 isoform X2 [Alosa sapidissima]
MLCATSPDLEPDDNTSFYILNVGQPQSVVNQSIGIPRHGMQSHSHSHSQVISTSPRLQSHKVFDPGYELQQDSNKCSQPPGSGQPPKAFECPSIQITSISPSCQQEMDANDDDKGHDRDYHHDRPMSRDHLYLPLDHSYRDSSLSPSPCSSLSSRSWFSDASSCESFSHVYDDVDSELNEAAARFTLGSPLTSPGCSPQAGGLDEPWQHQQQQQQQQQQQHHHHPAFAHSHSLSPRQSPCHSPRTSVTDENWLSPRPPSRPSSRPTSPCGKRRHSSADICYPGSVSPHHSPSPTPGPSPRGSVTEDTWIGSPSMGMSPFQCCPSEADIPSKTRKTSQDRTPPHQPGKGDLGLDDSGNVSPLLDSPAEEALLGLKKDGPGEQFLSVPSHFTWNKPKPGHTPIFRTSSLPPLDWPLPNQFGQYELKIEVHPKAHHRAHYETEGSRGAVKAASGGHPVVKLLGYSEKPVNLQMFIGTADDRYLRPHAFYQVHRITGKTVATASQEIIITSTKVLEIPLLPENNMSASIDCAGILKLRNSDIELRKGETDIGRKNTRVRVVFRVHIPQPNGKVLSLQAASIPIECSQRSAQELPQVEKCSLSSCVVSGGEEMVISGSNFFPESKVIFLEKGPDGRPQWEVEGKIVREKSQGSSLVVQVPPYHSKTVTSAVQVQFYVCNGKRKRSQSQRFTYLSVLVKQEHRDDLDASAVASMPLPLAHAGGGLVRTQMPSPEPGHPQDGLLSSSPRGLAPGLHPLQPPCGPPMGSPTFPHLPHLQGHGLHAGPDCQMAFHAGPHPHPHPHPHPSRPPYQPMQHGHGLPFNGQPSLPMSTGVAGSPQAFERMPYQSDPAACHSHALGLGMVYHSASSVPNSGHSPTSPLPIVSAASGTPGGQPMAHSSPHLHSLGYHCPNPAQVSSPTHSMGQQQQQQQQQQSAPPMQRPMGGYHPAGQRSASCPSPSSIPQQQQQQQRMVPSPHSGPSSPQLHSLPYQSPTSPSPTAGSPLGPMSHSSQPSPQASSPVLGSLPSAAPMVHPLGPQAPFPADGERLNIKQEPEEREPTFRSIGLQDITLDDVNEIIGRDMSQSPGSHHAAPPPHSQS